MGSIANGSPRVRRSIACAAAMAALVAFYLATAPFSRPLQSVTASDVSGATTARFDCSAPVLDAFRHHGPDQSGWFGYAPLTSTPFDGSFAFFSDCKPAARDRLEIAVGFAVVAGALVLTLRRPRATSPA